MFQILDLYRTCFSEEKLSPGFSPTSLPFPKRVHSDADDKFKELADTIYNRSVQGKFQMNRIFEPVLEIFNNVVF